MLLLAKTLFTYGIRTPEDELGHCRDLYVDDRDWSVRYVVVDTGGLLPGKKVLLAPQVFGPPDPEAETLPTGLSPEQVQNAPALDEHEPVSRRHEAALARHYGWEAHWLPPLAAFPPPNAPPVAPLAADLPEPQPAGQDNDAPDQTGAHLRSLREVTGYGIAATDAPVGHTVDGVVETDDWEVHYLLVDTRNWLPGKKVLIDTERVTGVDWRGRLLQVDRTREDIRQSPPFAPDAPVNQVVEHRLYDYAGHPRGG
ncbi:MAG: hypothetical protein ACOCX4_00055 [Planctomycetota bacterium]